MSIPSISSRGLNFSSAPLAMDEHADRRSSTPEASVFSVLSSADRDVISAMFGPDVLSTGYDGEGKLVGIPEFVSILIGDRIGGRLPSGVEVTSTYLQAIWDHYTSYAGPGTIVTPLTKQNLVAGLQFLSRRSQGGALDIRA